MANSSVHGVYIHYIALQYTIYVEYEVHSQIGKVHGCSPARGIIMLTFVLLVF